MDTNERLAPLVAYVQRVPAVSGISAGADDNSRRWWIKFRIDLHHGLAWRVVQEFAFVLNYLSVNERLPTVFMPVSPPPYMNGGPDDFLSWVIESTTEDVNPEWIGQVLEGRLPRPVENTTEWQVD